MKPIPMILVYKWIVKNVKVNFTEAFHAAFLKYKEETARRARVMQDETSEEGQRYIQELIQRQNIEYMVGLEAKFY